MPTNEPQTKPCPHCKASIDANAAKCRHCSTDLRNWFRRHPVLTVLIILFLAPFFVTAIKDQNKARSIPTANEQAASKANLDLLKTLSITSSKIVPNIIGVKEWHVTIKNTGTKDVDAYRVAGDLFDNFDKPVSKFNSTDSTPLVGLSQDLLKPGASEADIFSLVLQDRATKIKNPRIVSIHFTDGSSVTDPDFAE